MSWEYPLFATIMILAHWYRESARHKLPVQAEQIAGDKPSGGPVRLLPVAAAAALVGLLAGGWLFAEYRGGAIVGVFLFAFVLNSLHGRMIHGRIDALAAQGQAARQEESEQRFRNLADYAPALLQVTDSAGDPIFFNKTWSEFTGQPLAALSGQGWLELVHPEDRPTLAARRTAALARQNAFRCEFRLRHASGGYRWVMAAYQPRWEGGRLAGYIGSCADVTAHRLLEQALRHQVEYEKLLAAVSAKFVNISPPVLDTAVRAALGEIGRFTGADRAYIYLYSDDFSEACLAYEWNTAGVPPIAAEKLVIDIGADSVLTAELRTTGRLHIPRVGALPAGADKEKLVAANIKSIVVVALVHGDRMLGFLGLHSFREEKAWREEDILLPKLVGEVILGAIQRCQAETALAISEAENTAILASVPDILYHVGADGTILDTKPSGRRTGLPAPAPVGCGLDSFLPAPLVRPALAAIATVLASGEVQIFEYHRKTGGAVNHYEARVTKAGDRDVLIIVRDVTERRQAEQEMLLAREAIARAERLSSLGIMAAGISHEINQPLNSLKVTADGMLYWHGQGKTPALAKIMENLGKISKQADRIDNIVKHMRFFVRSSQHGEPEPCDINAAVKESLSLIGAQLAAHAIAVDTTLAAGLPPVLANSTQIEEVIINLLVNAMQSLDAVNKPDKSVAIVSGRQKGEVFLEISDNGPGIGSRIRGKVFEPFFTTKPVGEGMGLGLSIVHTIVSSYGGQITVKGARRSRGAAFLITFPAYNGQEKGGEKQA